ERCERLQQVLERIARKAPRLVEVGQKRDDPERHRLECRLLGVAVSRIPVEEEVGEVGNGPVLERRVRVGPFPVREHLGGQYSVLDEQFVFRHRRHPTTPAGWQKSALLLHFRKFRWFNSNSGKERLIAQNFPFCSMCGWQSPRSRRPTGSSSTS